MADIEKLGRYEIIRVLGKGAMGVVYEGRDPNLDRRVAIKTIRVQSLNAEAAAEYEGRFRIEARSAARLHHPNIVSVFDSAQDQDIAYLVMEFIQGQDLKHHLENGARFSVRSAIVMVHELLMALDHAHRQNVVHRDIKPANLLIESSGRVKLTDFGVARIQEPDETNLTQVGGAVGTPKYMSPEQAKGLRGDSRSDVFSAGVVLYELLTGTMPFDGENQFMVIHQIVGHAHKRPSEINGEVPAAMDEVMGRALAKDPDERYATAREFALALRAVALRINETSGSLAADVAGDLGQIPAHRAPLVVAALRDGSSTGIFGPSAEVAMGATINHEAELEVWNDIQDSTNSQDFVGYLRRFPSGIYARRAQLRLDQLALDDTASRAKTEPQFRPTPTPAPAPAPAPAPGLDPDSTVGPFQATRPMEDTQAPRAVPPPQPANTPQEPPADTEWDFAMEEGPEPRGNNSTRVPRRRTWPLLLLGGGLLSALVAAGIFFRPLHTVDKPLGVKPSLAANEELIVSTPKAHPSAEVAQVAVPAPVAAPTVAEAAPSAAPVAPTSVSRPAAHAARPAKPKANPAPVAVAQDAPHEPPPMVSPSSNGGGNSASNGNASGVGPSAPGQVCADKMFLLRVPCIAQQCNADRFRHTAECIRFKELERRREEERNSRR